MRCLEKRPADRWQTAAELVPQLDALATPSGGTAPTGDAAGDLVAAPSGDPAGASGAGGAAVRRRVGSGARGGRIPDVSDSAFPTGCSWGAGVLLLIGLPIMVVTSLHERRRAAGADHRRDHANRAGAARAGSPGGGRSWAAGLAFAGLTLVAGGYTAMRLLGIGPGGNSAGVGGARRAGRRSFSRTSRTAQPTPPGRLGHRGIPGGSRAVADTCGWWTAGGRDALHRMQRPGGITISPGGGPRGRGAGGRQGDRDRPDRSGGQGYVLSANLLSAPDGERWYAVRETAADRVANCSTPSTGSRPSCASGSANRWSRSAPTRRSSR